MKFCVHFESMRDAIAVPFAGVKVTQYSWGTSARVSVEIAWGDAKVGISGSDRHCQYQPDILETLHSVTRKLAIFKNGEEDLLQCAIVLGTRRRGEHSEAVAYVSVYSPETKKTAVFEVTASVVVQIEGDAYDLPFDLRTCPSVADHIAKAK